MDKPGTHHMTMGAVWLVVGVVLTVGTLWLFKWQGGVLFYGAILVGGIQFIVGMFQRVVYELSSDENKAKKHAEASLITLVRCMALVANADGRVDDSEITAIGTIYEQLTGSHLPDQQIRDIVSGVGHGGDDPADFIASLGTQVPMEFRLLVAKVYKFRIRLTVALPGWSSTRPALPPCDGCASASAHRP